jgi:3-hydroxyacyl-CoA dehydrogenase/enoyl-CoA hydratase/3-hydroxybutyryl-CoA epimerase
MLSEGIPPAAIEQAALQAGFPTAPLALLDEVSLTLALAIDAEARAAAEASGQQYELHPGTLVMRRMVEEFGRSGRATGAGFYDYPASGKKQLWAGLSAFGSASIPTEPMDVTELKERLLYIQAIETLRCLEERVLESPRDANIGSIYGIGFPGWTGGSAQFVNHIGTRAFAQRAEALASSYGSRFAPPTLLRELAEHGLPLT